MTENYEMDNKSNCYHDSVNRFVSFSSWANKAFPMLWVVMAQLFMIIILLSDELVGFLNLIHDHLLAFTHINDKYPFSTPIAKAYVVLLIIAIPFQVATIIQIGIGRVEEIIKASSKRKMVISSIFFSVAALIILFRYSPGQHGIPGMLGGGMIAVAILAPLLTSLVSLALALNYFFVFNLRK